MKTLLYFFSILLTLGRPARDPIVLMYHSISNGAWKLSVPPREFARQMSFLRRARTPVTLSDVILHAKGTKRLSPGAVAVTFDDGYRDFATDALPILKRYGIPVTVFVPSDYSVDTSGRNIPRLTAEELKTLSKERLVQVGAHGSTHKKLTELPPERAFADIIEGRASLETILSGNRVTTFAYPFGARNASVEALAERAEFDGAVTITEGTVLPGTPRHCIPRVQIDRTMSFISFVARTGAALMLFRTCVDSIRARAL